MPVSLTESEFMRFVRSPTSVRYAQQGCEGISSRFSPFDDRGRVRYSRVELPAQLTALRVEFDVAEDLVVELEDSNELLLTFFMEGAIEGKVGGAVDRPLDFRVNHAMLRVPNHRGFVVRIPRALHSSFVQLRFDQSFFKDFVGRLRVALPQGVADSLRSQDGTVIRNAAWRLDTQLVLDQIARFRYGPTAFLPFLQAKAWELLTLFTCEMMRDEREPPALRGRPIENAQELLLEDIANAPSVPSLARRVGMSVAALQSGFKARYGDTVFGYLREQRLKRARDLLLNRQLTVLDVIQEVGWTCPSRFAAAFRARYGVAPSDYRRQLR